MNLKLLITALIFTAALFNLAVPAAAETMGGDMAWYNIYCNVVGANVYFDGDYKGQITSAGYLVVSVYTTGAPYSKVTVESAGYYPASTSLPAVSTGSTAKVYVTLNPSPTQTVSQTGNLYVQTAPAGARVHLNDVYQGLAPLTISNLKAGTSYRIDAEMDGFEKATKTVTVSAGTTQTVYLALASPGSISVTSSPSGAYVSLNNKECGKTPYVITGLSGGTYEIGVTMNGYYNWKRSVTVNEGSQQSVYAELQPISTSNQILVTSEPWGAKIYLDNVYVGETLSGASFPVQDVANGVHTLKLTLSGYSDYSTSVTMAGATVSVFADMTSSTTNAGAVAVSSTPSGAMIYVDDVYKGFSTPNTISGLSAGEHTIMLRLSGYQDTYSKVMVYSGQTTTLNLGMAYTGSSTQPVTPTQKSAGFGVIISTIALFGALILISDRVRKE